MERPKFIADQNVGKLGRRLRMAGFDTILFEGPDDSEMVRLGLEQGRTILTRDTRFVRRRLVVNGTLKAILFVSDDPVEQFRQVLVAVDLDSSFCPFSICIEDNQPLVDTPKEMVEDRVPPFVFGTQEHFMECPLCRRVYWRGTHWQAMKTMLSNLAGH